MLVANVSELRKNLKKYIDTVSDKNDTLIVTGSGKTVVMISLDEYNKMDETEYLLSTNANKEMMYAALEQVNSSKLIKKSLVDIEQIAKGKTK
jgi:antitoxin YefM